MHQDATIPWPGDGSGDASEACGGGLARASDRTATRYGDARGGSESKRVPCMALVLDDQHQTMRATRHPGIRPFDMMQLSDTHTWSPRM